MGKCCGGCAVEKGGRGIGKRASFFFFLKVSIEAFLLGS